jgi:hypothetical protein
VVVGQVLAGLLHVGLRDVVHERALAGAAEGQIVLGPVAGAARALAAGLAAAFVALAPALTETDPLPLMKVNPPDAHLGEAAARNDAGDALQGQRCCLPHSFTAPVPDYL